MLAVTPFIGVVLGYGALKSQRAVEPMELDPEGEKPILRVPEPEAPQKALLEGAAPQKKYRHLA